MLGLKLSQGLRKMQQVLAVVCAVATTGTTCSTYCDVTELRKGSAGIHIDTEVQA